MKKKLWLLAVTALIVGIIAMSLSLTGCDNGSSPSSHNHNWGEWTVTTAATCSAAGAKERVCKDDAAHKETDVIPIDTDAHDYHFVEGSGTAPTCTEDGEGNEVCSYNSSHTKSGVVIPIDPNAHDWGGWAHKIDATCTEAEEERTCTNDGSHKETQSVGSPDADAHAYGSWTTKTPATCTEAEVQEKTCTHDGSHKDTQSVGSPDADAHGWGDWTLTSPITSLTSVVEKRTCSHDAGHTDTRTGTFADYLSNLPANPAPDAPYNIVIKVNNLSGAYNTTGTLGNALYTKQTKRVILDLSGSTYNSNTVPQSAFRDCTNLVGITLPDSVTSIGAYIFYDCTSLASLNLGDGVTRIDNYTFSNNTSLTSITIGKGLTTITSTTFLK